MSNDRDQIQASFELVREMLPSFVNASEKSTADLESIVRLLLRRDPNLASTASVEDRSLPLHFAASIGDIGVARALIAMYPQAASAANKKGKIPLHYAAREGRTEMVQFLLQVDPLTARIPTKKKKLALHFAAGEGHTNVVRALLRVNPEGAVIPSLKGKLPLHFAARWGHMLVAQDLVYYHPTGVAAFDWEGSLPLHDSAREGQIDMTQFLMKLYPLGLSTANMRGEIPLFPAVRSGNVALVICLLQAWPKGGKHILQHVTADDNVNEWDNNILELCLRGGVENFNNCTLLARTDKVIVNMDGDALQCPTLCNERNDFRPTLGQPVRPGLAILSKTIQDSEVDDTRQAYDSSVRPKSPVIEERVSKKRSPIPVGLTKKRTRSDSLSETSNCPCCPYKSRNCKFYHLHAALSCGSSASVLKVVLERFGDNEIRQINCQGQLPLHVAMSNTTTDEAIDVVLKDILGSYPEAATVRDNKGRLPLHVALESQANFRLTHALLEVYPISKVEPCQTRDARYVDKAPLWMATTFDCDLSTTYFLLRNDPSLLFDLQ